MRLITLFLLTLLVLPAVAATQLITIDGSAVTEALVQVREGAESRDYLVSTEQPLDLSGGTDGMTVLVKAGDGESFDYYAELPAGPIPDRIVLHPAGLVLGEVSDDAENLIVGAAITIDCPTKSVETTSDGAGGFRLFLPAERCRFSAVKEGRAASANVEILRGEVTEVPLVLETKGTPWLWSLVVLVLVVVLWFVLRKREVVVDEQQKPSQAHFVAEGVKRALKEKEVLIVDELLLRGGKASLTALRTAVKLPRTSMLRCLEGLENRGLLLKKSEKGKIMIELVKKR